MTVPTIFKPNNDFLKPRYIQSMSEPVRDYTRCTNDGSYTSLYTVTTGKTFYLTSVIFANDDDFTVTNLRIGVNSSTIFGIGDLAEGEATTITFSTPLKFTSGQTIQEYQLSAANPDTDVTLIGWEE